MRSEEDLVETLRAAAGQAGPANFAEGVSRRRRARQRGRVLLAAAAVVTVVGGTTAVLSGQEPAAPPVAASPAPRSIVPVAELWPRAVLKIPADGGEAYPVTGLSATELLMATKTRLQVYDSATGKTRVLGEIPYPMKQYFPQGFAVGERYIAWHGENDENREWADFWIMPREGGEARRIGEVAADVDGVGLTGDHLVWSLRKGGVYRMPLSGGTPELLPGTDRLHLSSWPWAREGGDGANTTRIANLETGQSTAVALPEGIDMMQCHPQWCAGVRDGRLIVQRVDGSGRTTLPGTLLRMGFRWLYGDRYALFLLNTPERQQPVLYDLTTGTMAGLGDGAQSLISPSPSTVLFWGTGKERTVLNLKAVTG
ncbi:hypothetical protein AB0I81_10125 [Nonomuraea sp. NPDC050404]|uniref:hypothetical protein n=1 Tax=Nonomuraea sp. NPDC050404 TaxID=3155783 RepID=UPI0033CBC40D